MPQSMGAMGLMPGGARPALFAVLLALSQAAWIDAVRFADAEPPGFSVAAASDTAAPYAPARGDGPGPLLEGPTLAESPQAPPIALLPPAQGDEPLPINLATALHLSNARPLVIAFAETAVERAAAQLQRADVLWLPSVNIGFDYYRHSGADQSTNGTVIFDSKNAFNAGAGATVVFGVTDAIFAPLALRQELAAREWDVQSARNDALLGVAAAYFDVQEARGRLAASFDAAAKADALEKRFISLATGLVPEMEVDRARTLLFELKQQVSASRAAWRVASARLTRALRLNPGSVVVPQEPPHLQVTLIAPSRAVDDLIPVGLLNRPELASQRALVEATLVRIRQERLRPLLPSAVLVGRGPGGINGSIFGGGPNDGTETWGGRFDVDMGLVWTLENLGAGNRALVRQRTAERQLALIELFNLQDRVAQEVVQAQAQLQAAASQVGDAASGVKEALVTYQGNLTGISQLRRVGDVNVMIIRPQEAVAALQALIRAYDNYYAAVNGYNRAEFQLYHALGCPSRILAWDRPLGEIQPVNTDRPPSMAPVCPHVLSSPER